MKVSIEIDVTMPEGVDTYSKAVDILDDSSFYVVTSDSVELNVEIEEYTEII